MRKMRNVTFAVFALILMSFLTNVGCCSVDGGKDFYVKDFGAVADGKADDGPAIRKAIYAAIKYNKPASVVFEGDKAYRIGEREDRWESFDIIGAKDLTIEGNGASLVISPNARGFILQKTERCTVRGFNIDYDPLPFTQGDVVAIDRDKGTFDVKLQDGFADPPSQKWMEENYIKPGWSAWRFGTVFCSKAAGKWFGIKGYGNIQIDRVDKVAGGDRVFRITIRQDYRKSIDAVKMEVGDQFVFRVRYSPYSRNKNLKGLPVSNFRIIDNKDCTIENINQYCSPNQSMTMTDNTGRVTVRNYNILLKPGTNRLISNLSDGLHCKNNRVGPIIENCYFEGLLDDSINISCMAEVVQKIIADNKFLVWSANIAWYIHPIDIGDEMQVIDAVAGTEICRAKVTAVDYKQDRFRVITLDRDIKGVVAGKDTEDRKCTEFFNLSRSGKGYIIRNNKFSYQTRDAMLLRTSGLIENNVINDVGGHGIWLGNDLQFAEGPVPENVIIRNNTISACPRNTGIVIASASYSGAANHLINNITIENNVVEGFAFGSGISIVNARDIHLKDNIVRTDMIDNSKGNRFWSPIMLENCKAITIDGGVISDSRDKIKGGIYLKGQTTKDDVKISGIKFFLGDLISDVIED